MLKWWEIEVFKVEGLKDDLSGDVLKAALNEYGKCGWEPFAMFTAAAHTTGIGFVWMKREKQS